MEIAYINRGASASQFQIYSRRYSNGITGYKFGNTLFLPYSGYVPQHNSPYTESGLRGLFWSTPGTVFIILNPAYQQGEIGYVDWNIFPQNNYAIRCVRNI